MGVRGLWETIHPAQEIVSLLNLAAVEGFQRSARRTRTLLLGVDACTMLHECAAVEAQKSGDLTVQDGTLRNLFFKLCNFLKTGVTIVFVFDSRGRGKTIVHQDDKIRECAKALIKAFGYYQHDVRHHLMFLSWQSSKLTTSNAQAPGEAEAELAKLSSLGYIDAVVTSNSNTLVFGAQCVLRQATDSQDPNVFEMYQADIIEASDEVALTPSGLILFALLSGGDYGDGIPGCGRAVAHSLAKCGFGNSLLHGLNTKSNVDFKSFLATWRRDLRSELLNNTQGRLETCHPSLASCITSEFPDPHVLAYYAEPLTSWSNLPGNSLSPVNHSAWIPREPEIGRITQYCRERFQWTASVVQENFSAKLWPGILISMLCSKYVLYDADRNLLATPNTNARVHIGRQQAQDSKLHLPVVANHRLVASPSNFIALMRSGIDGDNASDFEVLVPEPFLPLALLSTASAAKVR
ncbi:PIN domain-like protein [Lyophyllum atratum]|nr:PIN domain-like protein [Lyophyllum atratum]